MRYSPKMRRSPKVVVSKPVELVKDGCYFLMIRVACEIYKKLS